MLIHYALVGFYYFVTKGGGPFGPLNTTLPDNYGDKHAKSG